jgi:hypothetical protein
MIINSTSNKPKNLHKDIKTILLKYSLIKSNRIIIIYFSAQLGSYLGKFL